MRYKKVFYYIPKVVNDVVLVDSVGVIGSCGIAVIDEQLSSREQVKSRNLEMNSLPQLVHGGLSWHGPCI